MRQARQWYRKAAVQGNPKAQVTLGLMYEKGEGVPHFVRAHMWSNVAAAALSRVEGKTAMKNRERVASRMIAAQIGTAQEMARRCQVTKFKDCD